MEVLRSRKYLITFSLLSALALISVLSKPVSSFERSENILKGITDSLDNWQLEEEFDLSKTSIDILSPTDYLFRRYKNNKSEYVTLCIIYHKNKRWGAHDPETCYQSKGWKVRPGIRQQVYLSNSKVLYANSFEVEKDRQHELVYYWFSTSNGYMTGSRFWQMVYLIVNGIFYNNIETVFFKLSTYIDDNTAEASERIKEFTKQLIIEPTHKLKTSWFRTKYNRIGQEDYESREIEYYKANT
jgi:EpsI family protein